MLKRSLIGPVIVFVAFVQLLFASPIWTSVLLTATLLILSTSIVCAILRTNGDRAFWVGFSVFGIGYFAVAMHFSPGQPEYQLDSQPQMLTTMLLNDCYAFLSPSAQETEAGFYDTTQDDIDSTPADPLNETDPNAANESDSLNEQDISGGFGGEGLDDTLRESPVDRPSSFLMRIQYVFPKYDNFLLAGECVWCLGIATLGGAISRVLYFRR